MLQAIIVLPGYFVARENLSRILATHPSHMVMINAVQVGDRHVDFLVLFALPCLLLLGSDCFAHFHHQFLGSTGSTRCGIDYLAMSLKGSTIKATSY